MIKSVRSIRNLKGKRVLLRLDLNIPMENGRVVDPFRIEESLPTIEYLRKKGAVVIIIAHIESDEATSLKVTEGVLRKSFPLTFIEHYWTEETLAMLKKAKEGEVFLFENLRLHKEEKENNPLWCKRLASLAEVYVNEAFSASHRDHASITGLPKFLPSYAGELFMREKEGLSRVFSPKHPFLFVIGGAKFETKLPLVEKFLSIADVVFLGGALAHDIWKSRDLEVGKSTVSETSPQVSHLIDNKKIILPEDVVVQGREGVKVKKPHEVLPDDSIYDAGPRSREVIKARLKDSKMVLWNGPLGFCEKGFCEGTHEFARALAESGVESIVGGGDTLGAIKALGIADKFTFVSTAGGAMLEFLAKGTLPGIEALKRSQRPWFMKIFS